MPIGDVKKEHMNDDRRITYAEALNEALREEMERDSSVYILGEDIAKIGGLFDVTKGLLDEFGPQRVIDTDFGGGHCRRGHRRRHGGSAAGY